MLRKDYTSSHLQQPVSKSGCCCTKNTITNWLESGHTNILLDNTGRKEVTPWGVEDTFGFCAFLEHSETIKMGIKHDFCMRIVFKPSVWLTPISKNISGSGKSRIPAKTLIADNITGCGDYIIEAVDLDIIPHRCSSGACTLRSSARCDRHRSYSQKREPQAAYTDWRSYTAWTTPGEDHLRYLKQTVEKVSLNGRTSYFRVRFPTLHHLLIVDPL